MSDTSAGSDGTEPRKAIRLSGPLSGFKARGSPAFTWAADEKKSGRKALPARIRVPSNRSGSGSTVAMAPLALVDSPSPKIEMILPGASGGFTKLAP